ncbi:MAG: glycosyltransferase family 1 protein [Pirellulaceae bacterium]
MNDRPSVWFDATTVHKLRNQTPVGLTRIEANVLQGAMQEKRFRTRFCIYDRYSDGLVSLAEDAVRNYTTAHGNSPRPVSRKEIAGKGGAWRSSGRSLERSLRVSLRSIAGHTKRRLGIRADLPWRAGDAFVISGSTWDTISVDLLEDLTTNRGVRLICILSDMIPYHFPHHFQEPESVAKFVRFVGFLARSAASVVCISHSTEREFVEFAQHVHGTLPATKVIHLGSDSSTSRPATRPALPHDVDSRGFVLNVGTVQVRKNHQLLYNLWRRLAQTRGDNLPYLVIAGAKGWLTSELLHQIEVDPIASKVIKVMHHVSDADLHWLYNHCQFTLYPALHEGWGLPIVESMQHGKPCIASSTSSMPEAGQGLTTSLDPLDFHSWQAKIIQWISDPEELKRESAWIMKHFRHRTWDNFRGDFFNHIDTLLSGQTSRLAA